MALALRRPEVAVAGLLALLVHGAMFGVLVVGFTLKKQPPPKVVVELWREMPPVNPVRKAEAPPPPPVVSIPSRPPAPEPAAAPPAPKPVPEPAGKPSKPPEILTKAEDKPPEAPSPEAAKAEAKLLEKREEEKKLREQKALEDRQRKEERKRLEQSLREDEQKRLAEQRRLDAERQKEEEARRKQEEEELRPLQEALQKQKKLAEDEKALREKNEVERKAAVLAAAKAQKAIEDYTQSIRLAIREKIALPPGMSGNPQAVFEVKLLKSGMVASIELIKSSGMPAYDRAVERAIDAAQPLPVPDDVELFQQLRDLTLVFRPND